jgi:tetratricopeptide (TPR) repeat protein
LRDRAGPLRLLEAMDQIWNSMEIISNSNDIDAIMADRLFRMGNVMQNIGMFNYAAEHFGASFKLCPSAEAATMIGWTFGIQENNHEARAWCRRAIETNPDLGDPWNDIGAILLSNRQVEEAMSWFRAAINAERSLSPGHPWSNMARAHLMNRNSRAAFFAAQQAIIHMPDDTELLMLLDELGSDLC